MCSGRNSYLRTRPCPYSIQSNVALLSSDINIFFENVREEAVDQYITIFGAELPDTYGQPYDFNSIIHYGATGGRELSRIDELSHPFILFHSFIFSFFYTINKHYNRFEKCGNVAHKARAQTADSLTRGTAAPAGKKVEVIIRQISYGFEIDGCMYGGLELKPFANATTSGYR
ncbi:hypothetical protein Q1695_003529 [Nippostrongylus brasiliensis]|nr:hypothetical protein Q1695_003529 [Nippostrongylus brasiliensis]